MFKLRVFSPNKSCAPLRNVLFNKRILLRLGSTTPLISKHKYLEINTIKGIKISANKLIMKHYFDKARINHSEWISGKTGKDAIRQFLHVHKIVIAKDKHSSKGNDIYYIDNIDYLENLFSKINIERFIFEKYYFFPNEYRLHVDVNHGCFYACKKILKEDAEVQWHKHGNNSVFVHLTGDHTFPECWSEMVSDCIKVMKEMKLTIACFDILCSNNFFIIVESNTAPSLASYGITHYNNHLKKWYDSKF